MGADKTRGRGRQPGAWQRAKGDALPRRLPVDVILSGVERSEESIRAAGPRAQGRLLLSGACAAKDSSLTLRMTRGGGLPSRREGSCPPPANEFAGATRSSAVLAFSVLPRCSPCLRGGPGFGAFRRCKGATQWVPTQGVGTHCWHPLAFSGQTVMQIDATHSSLYGYGERGVPRRRDPIFTTSQGEAGGEDWRDWRVDMPLPPA